LVSSFKLIENLSRSMCKLIIEDATLSKQIFQILLENAKSNATNEVVIICLSSLRKLLRSHSSD